MALYQLGSVGGKMPCVFETILVPLAPSAKRADRKYRVTASSQLRVEAAAALAGPGCVATEKLDGTCVLVFEHRGKPWLWARHDRKPSKAGEKRQKQFSASGLSVGEPQRDASSFKWNVETDYKEMPNGWIPAIGVIDSDGCLLPDANGHIPGYIPVDPKARQHCWHSSVVDLEMGLCLLLQHPHGESDKLEIVLEPLSTLLGATLELIGTCVNANPYRLGTKEKPVHLLVRHGSVRFFSEPPTDYVELVRWFAESAEGRVEGVVWHCAGGAMYKLHRHHVDLNWPVDEPRLLTLAVRISASAEESEVAEGTPELMRRLLKVSGKTFDSLDRMSF